MNAFSAVILAAETAPIVRVLAALAVVLALGRVVGALFVKLRQPIVIGEIVAGIALGPSLLGLFPGELDRRLFPPEVLPYLSVVSKLGIVLFMFVIGLELDMSVVRRSGRRAVAISLSSIMLPFALGAAVLAPFLFDRYAPEPLADGRSPDLAPFALFVGVSMCGSAFAILARILAERDMFKIPLGATLVACAAIDDVVVFTLLAVTTAIASGGGLAGVGVTMMQLTIIVVILVVVVRPLLDRLVVKPYTATGRFGSEQMAIVFLFLMLTSWATAWIGVSELIGAFLFGAVIPREPSAAGQQPPLFPTIAGRVEGVSVQLLLPVFFVVAGQGVVLGGLGLGDVVPAVAVIAVASLGKFVGGATAARATGVPRRQSLAVGTLLNTRGLAELVVLGLARDLGVISTKVYTMLVVMAVVTTVASGPLLRLVYPDRALKRDIADAERAGSGAATDRALIVVEDSTSAADLVDVAVAFGGARPTSAVTLVQFVPAEEGFAAVPEALATLHMLRRRCEEAGVACTVVCRPSASPQSDLLDEVRRVAPDAVILNPSQQHLVADITQAGSDAVVVHHPLNTQAGVTSPGGGALDDHAALEVAVRLALHADTPLKVINGSRRLLRQLSRLGVRLGEANYGVSSTSGDGSLRVAAGRRDRVSVSQRLGPWRLGDVVTPLSSR
jgi:Kef-type K+ transport system membrane component KefB